MRQIQLLASVIEDQRQLDGSRHVEIVGEAEDAELALRLVIDRNGLLQEAELSLETDGASVVIGFDAEREVGEVVGDDERLTIRLRSEAGEVDVTQQEDGEIALTMSLTQWAGGSE